jgi:hypothetical protein
VLRPPEIPSRNNASFLFLSSVSTPLVCPSQAPQISRTVLPTAAIPVPRFVGSQLSKVYLLKGTSKDRLLVSWQISADIWIGNSRSKFVFRFGVIAFGISTTRDADSGASLCVIGLNFVWAGELIKIQNPLSKTRSSLTASTSTSRQWLTMAERLPKQ